MFLQDRVPTHIICMFHRHTSRAMSSDTVDSHDQVEATEYPAGTTTGYTSLSSTGQQNNGTQKQRHIIQVKGPT